jgi:hypothetical protein
LLFKDQLRTTLATVQLYVTRGTAKVKLGISIATATQAPERRKIVRNVGANVD